MEEKERGTRNPAAPAKISQPRPFRAYARKRLFRQLDRCRERPIVWVNGPPGSGKTTLVASYLQHAGDDVLWYQLDRGDGDPAGFFHYLTLAAARLHRSKGLPRLTAERRGDLEVFARRFFEQLFANLRAPFVLVFDHYHEVPADSVLHDVMRCGLEELTEGGCAIVVSRQGPPTTLGRLVSNRMMAFVSAEDLRLRLEETRGIAGLWRRWEAARRHVPALHRYTEGWAAGLVLTLEHGAPDAAGRAPAGGREHMFRYFAGEILQHRSRATRDVLLKTSLLPTFSDAAARELTGNPHAGRIVAGLYERNYFTERVSDQEPVYRYHPLFREYLLASAERSYMPEELETLRKRAVACLEANGHLEEAAELCREIREWEALARLSEKLAPELLARGRNDTLKAWLTALREQGGVAGPWIDYWLAQAELPFDPQRAAVLFEEAYQGHERTDNEAGRWLAWAGIVDAIVYCWDDFARLDPWISRLERFDRDRGHYPSLEIEAHVSMAMFSALMFRRPEHPAIRQWAERALALVHRHGDPALLIRTVEHQCHYYIWVGNLTRAGELLESGRALMESEDLPIIVLLGHHMQTAVYRWHSGELQAAIEATDAGLELGRRHGARLFENRLAAQGVFASMGAGDTETAARYLAVMTEAIGSSHNLDTSHNHHLRGQLALLCGDRGAALEASRRATELAEQMGTPFPTALAGMNLARALHANGDTDAAWQRLAVSRDIAQAMGSPILECQCSLIAADFSLTAGDVERGVTDLRSGLAIARRSSYWMLPCWDPALLGRLCARALERDIETEFVRRLIQRRAIAPPQGAPAPASWPWPVCVRTLGGLRVERDGLPLEFDGKAQRKPLDLLCILVALAVPGGRAVHEQVVSDMLWPDAEGDAAARSLAVTLHRARKLLGRDDAIIRAGGLITVNERCLWTDATYFSDALDFAESLPPGPGRRQQLAGILRLYDGPFLKGYPDAPWAIPPRDRLEERFNRVLTSLARDCESDGQVAEALKWYEHGIEKAPSSEPLYRGLIRCYLRQGEEAAAASAYRRCDHALRTLLGVTPSPSTRALLKSS